MSRALVIGDGPSYHSVANYDWGSFDGLVISTHFYRHRAGAVVTIDPRGFNQKERHALGRTRLVVAMSHWANSVGLKRFVPLHLHSKVEWDWCTHPVLTSGVYAIEWAAKQGCKEIYTIGVDLTPGYHRKLDTQRGLLAKTLSGLQAKGHKIYKRSPASSLPVPVRDPAEHLPSGVSRPGPATRSAFGHPVAPRHSLVPSAHHKKLFPGQRRVLVRPRNGKSPRVVYVPDLPRN